MEDAERGILLNLNVLYLGSHDTPDSVESDSNPSRYCRFADECDSHYLETGGDSVFVPA